MPVMLRLSDKVKQDVVWDLLFAHYITIVYTLYNYCLRIYVLHTYCLPNDNLFSIVYYYPPSFLPIDHYCLRIVLGRAQIAFNGI